MCIYILIICMHVSMHLCEGDQNTHLLHLAQFLSKTKKGYRSLQTYSIDTSGEDLLKAAVHIGS